MQHVMMFPTTRQDVTDGYLISNVAILAEGTWNGVTYTGTELSKAAGQWRDNSIWNRHYEGRQRDETNTIGYVRNQRFEDGAIKGDVFLSNKSQEGRDMIEAVRTNQINGISVEHLSADYTEKGKVYATDISFLGAAIVPQPACNPCQLSKELNMEQKDFDKLNDTVAELAQKVEALSKIDVDNVVKEQSRKDSKVIADLEKRIKELENTPVHNTETPSYINDSYAGLTVEHGEIYRSI